MFNAEQECNKIVQWIREWFNENGKDCNAIIGISGGKDSTIIAALCVKALGKDRVIGVMMPQHTQDDIEDSITVCKALGIKNYTVDIGAAYDAIINSIQLGTDIDVFTQQTITNLPPRLRMSTLYAIGQSNNGRVVNTCNLSETLLGWETRWGDSVGDLAPISKMTATEVVAIGRHIAPMFNIPISLIDKAPSDGLCGGTDEDKMGIKYSIVDDFIRNGSMRNEEYCDCIKTAALRAKHSAFKRRDIECYNPGLDEHLEEYVKYIWG